MVSTHDPNYAEETLYRTEARRYFLYGIGNSNTRWAEVFPNGTRGEGSGVVPLSEREALAWAEQHLLPSRVVELFRAVIVHA